MEELAELKRVIRKFSFDPKKGYSRLLLQLFGYLGNGKSSFINTCKYVWDDGEFINHTTAKSEDGPTTMARLSYPLTKTITLVDNRGCTTMDSYEVGEIYAQLANLLPLDKLVEWSKGYELARRIKRAEYSVKTTDFIFPIFVHSVKKSIAPREFLQYRELLSKAREGNVAEKEKIFNNLGVERIFAFENYTPMDNIKTQGRHEDVLKFLHEVIMDVQFRLTQPQNPEREMIKHKRIVLNYIKYQEEETEKISKQKITGERPDVSKQIEKEKEIERIRRALGQQIEQSDPEFGQQRMRDREEKLQQLEADIKREHGRGVLEVEIRNLEDLLKRENNEKKLGKRPNGDSCVLQ
ncbi:Hypothetical predicted protein [Pelobates cultripes]|uniref:Uncharacterized protein n=1 Tax=Pelobates cultripes TaxID=61616 RepID=A0AAD1SR93_PELCU|nr:Hypothetical predicted protein [Pelobates cultripes]